MGIGFASWLNGHFWRMEVHGGQLYLGTWDWSDGIKTSKELAKVFGSQFGLDLYRSQDGIHWNAVTRTGFVDGGNTGGRTIKSTPVGLFIGTARPVGGGEIILCAPPHCTETPVPVTIEAPKLLTAAPESVGWPQRGT